MEINFEYPLYFLLFAIAIALALSFFLYRKDKALAGIQKWKLVFLFTLRFLFIAIIITLLLNPIVKRISIIENKPIIIWAQDNSSSIILNKDSAYYNNDYLNDVNNVISELSKDYEVVKLKFGEHSSIDSVFDFSSELTNISSVFYEVVSRYSGMNLGAVILASDGLYNTGINPVYSSHIKYPVYTLALGDTVKQKDLIIKDLIHNRIAFYKNTFPLRVLVTADKSQGEKTNLKLFNNNNEIYSNLIDVPESGEIAQFDIEITAEKLGLQQYKVVLEPVDGEISLENNYANFVIDVIDNRQKILILANSPHPDIGAINFATKDNPNFDIDIDYIQSFNGNISDYDLVILHQLPSLTNPAQRIFAEIDKNQIPILYILGSKSNLQEFNKRESGLRVSSSSNSFDNAQATINNDFLLFESGENIDLFVKTMPPLSVHFGEQTLSPQVKVFMHQVISGVKTNKPLIAFIDNYETKTGFILGEGLWKWRITNFRHFSAHDNFKEIVNKMLQFLVSKKLDEKLVTNYNRIYNQNESVLINAEFYNEAFELVPNQHIVLKIKNQDDKEFIYDFRDYGNSYRIDLGKMEPGTYSFIAEMQYDNINYISEGEFIIQSINLEFLNTTANHNILYRLANISNADLVFPENINDLPELIRKNQDIVTIASQQETSLSISDLYFLFFIILAFATSEWFFRKFWGTY